MPPEEKVNDDPSPRVVFDTSVLVSGIVHAGKSKLLIDAVLEEKIALVVSMPVIQEFKRVIARDKFRLSKEQQDTIVNFVLRVGNVVRVKSSFEVFREDPSDDIILRTAYDGKADYIVSGDDHLLSLKEFRGTKIVTVADMLEILS